MKRYLIVAGALMMIVSIFTGCAERVAEPEGTGTLKVMLTDAPGDFDEVNVTFSEISAHIDSAWVLIQGESVTVNLLELTNGRFMEIGSAEVPVGKYTQIRLSIEMADVVMEGTTHELLVPSSAQTGLKLVTEFEVEVDATLEVMIDFDAARSVVVAGTTAETLKYMLRPTIRVISPVDSE